MSGDFIEYNRLSFRCLLPAGGKVRHHFPLLRCEYPGDGFLRAVCVYRLAADARWAHPYLFKRWDVSGEGKLDGRPDIDEVRHSASPDDTGAERLYFWDLFLTLNGSDFKIALEGTDEIYRHGEMLLRFLSSIEFDTALFALALKGKEDRYGDQRRRMSEKFAEGEFVPYNRYGLECIYPPALSVKSDLPGFWLDRKGKYYQSASVMAFPEHLVEQMLATHRATMKSDWSRGNPNHASRVIRTGAVEDMPGWQEYLYEQAIRGTQKTFTHWDLFGRMGKEFFRIQITDELDFALTETAWRQFLQSLTYDPDRETSAPAGSTDLKRPDIPRGLVMTAANWKKLGRNLKSAAKTSPERPGAEAIPQPHPEDLSFTLPGWPWPEAVAERKRQEYADATGLPPLVDLPLAPDGPATFVLIPPGRFVMGGWLSLDAHGNLRPFSAGQGKKPRKGEEVLVIYPVRVGVIDRPFYLMSTPVTQEMWQSVMDANPSLFKGEPNSPARPVETVSLRDIEDVFIPRAMERFLAGTGLALRLPCEMEWEYAYRAGSAGAFYSGQISAKKANYSGLRSFDIVEGTGTRKNDATSPVAGYPANPWGLYDMAGNVAELCRDEFAVYQTDLEKRINPGGGNNPAEDVRAIRGGSYASDDVDCHSFNHRPQRAASREQGTGFRLVLAALD